MLNLLLPLSASASLVAWTTDIEQVISPITFLSLANVSTTQRALIGCHVAGRSAGCFALFALLEHVAPECRDFNDLIAKFALAEYGAIPPIVHIQGLWSE